MGRSYQHVLGLLGVVLVITGALWAWSLDGYIYKTLHFMTRVQGQEESAADLDMSTSELKEEVLQLRAERASLMDLKRENQALRQAINTTQEREINPLIGHIVSFDNMFLRHTALLDTGADHDVEENQVVMYQGHVVGKIVEVKETSSRVQFILDPESRIGVSIGNEDNSQGMLVSKYGTDVTVDLVPRDELVEEGDPIYTSGVGDLPSGLVVGQVASVSEGDRFQDIKVDYPIRIRRLDTVFIFQ